MVPILFLSGLAAPIWAPAASSPALTRTNLLLGGTEFATEAYLRDSGLGGPSVLIVAGAHGNEPAGAAAAEVIRHWPIVKGSIMVIPRSNIAGLAAGTRFIPDAATNLANLNRNYPRAGKDEDPRGPIASAIWRSAQSYHPDWVLDLHEGFDFTTGNPHSVGSSIISYPNKRGKIECDRMLAAVNETVRDPVQKFVRKTMPVDGSLARAAGDHWHVPAFILETTSRQDLPRRILQHQIMVGTLLRDLGMLDPAFGSPLKEKSSGIIARIALYDGPGTGGAGPPLLLRKFRADPRAFIATISPAAIRQGELTNFDIAIFAGGGASRQAEALQELGRARVREFVGHGGGYVGICAGAYLATTGFSWGLNLINARTISPKWRRGRGMVQIEFSAPGRVLFANQESTARVLYANGPIVESARKAGLPEMEVLARFRTELAEHGTPAGIMVESPAIFAAPFEQGRVICISPHPEQTEGLEEVVPTAVAWALQRN